MRLNSSLIRSKSTGSLKMKCRRFCDYYNDNHSQSDSSLDVCVVDNRSDISSIEDRDAADAAPETYSHGLLVLERKINKLTDILNEQYILFRSFKEELITSKVVSNTCGKSNKPDLVKEYTETNEDLLKILTESVDFESQDKGAIKLLDAIEWSQVQRTGREIKDVLNSFLQSDDLKERIAAATAESVKEVIGKTFMETFPAAYLPVLEQSHRRLLRHVTRTLDNAFNELEAGSEGLFKSVHRTSHTLRAALEKHQAQLETNQAGSIFDNFQNNLELILKNELKEWREKILSLISACNGTNTNRNSEYYVPYSASSPPQPAHPDRSIIDQLMKSAEISKQINEGDINKSFEEALSSSDLSLVVAACKAADPTKIFSPPCSLKQSVLLSLIQQLATDMVHDTQLKCRYLEDSIISLDTSDQATRTYLPLIVGEVHTHLTKFIQWYPSHVASRRINLIIMAATNLLK